jgi:hypothetical protein
MRRIAARAAIACTPAFITRRLLRSDLAPRPSSPWLVANLHVRRPYDANGAWDSMIYGSAGLGYVNAGHQRTAPSDRTVLTYFRAYGHADVAGTRAKLLGESWATLASEILVDLEAADPELSDQTQRIDVMSWGHAMPRPRPGFRATPSPRMLAERVAWAHVDQTGFALFEEACTHGVLAAESICDALDVARGESHA